MARKPFPHQVERANDLLGLIHTDVCGPFRTVSREGVSYFIAFTNDFSRYGDIYEPPNYKAVLSYPKFDKWLEAMNTEMQSMKDNQVWVLVDLPPNEAEYIVATEASIESVRIRKFIDGLGNIVPSNKRSMEMLCHIEPAIIVLKKVHIDDNVADPFTKLMPFNKHYEHAMTIGIVPASNLI
ncbi:hypothetical protein Tco_1531648 [Tanacetum coccineum]